MINSLLCAIKIAFYSLQQFIINLAIPSIFSIFRAENNLFGA